MTSPYWRSASSAPIRKASAVRSTSVSASRIGLPASAAMSAPSVARRASTPAEMSRRMRPRSYAGMTRVTSNAATAASTACSYWASVARYVAPASSSGRAGFATSSTTSESTHEPAR